MVSDAPTRAGPAAGSLTPAACCAGTNPQNLVEKILRAKIYNHAYWKEHCFGLTAESLVDKAMELEAVGGTFGGILEPTTFISLMLKMLQVGLLPIPTTLSPPRLSLSLTLSHSLSLSLSLSPRGSHTPLHHPLLPLLPSSAAAATAACALRRGGTP